MASASGRPRASSRATLAEAATELFLERGYEATSVSDITTRAGVSRSSFFNYFSSKSDVLWAAFDERADAAAAALAADTPSVREVLDGIADGFAPDSLALAIVHAPAMGLEGELERERALRQARLAAAVAARARRDGAELLVAEVRGAAAAGAVLAAVWAWAHAGAGRTALAPLLHRALGEVPKLDDDSAASAGPGRGPGGIAGSLP